ncbi:MAG: DUF6440 family protein [Ruminococcus sp.]|jgi:hypothetical protein|nr:DUF6440 family protein [Ruminococcus sp.]
MKNDRFVLVKSQGLLTGAQILVDRETGVNYLFYYSSNAGGLTPLLGKDGKPIITEYMDNQ